MDEKAFIWRPNPDDSVNTWAHLHQCGVRVTVSDSVCEVTPHWCGRCRRAYSVPCHWCKPCAECQEAKENSARGRAGKGSDMSDNGKSEVKIKNFERQLRVELTADEIADRADRAAHLMAERDAMQEAADAARKAAKAQIEEREAEMRRLSTEIRDRATYRIVPCEERFEFRTGSVVEVRKDTGEQLSERPMNDDERQLELATASPNGNDWVFPPDHQPELKTRKKRGKKASTKRAQSTA